MAQKTKAALSSTLASNITTALNKQNTATKVIEVFQDIIDSMTNTLDDKLYTVRLALTNANLKSLTTSSGIEIVAAPGSGYAIEAISASISYDYATAGFDQAITPVIKTDTAAIEQMESNINFTGTSSIICRFRTKFSGSNALVDNKALKIYSSTTQATTGGGTAVLHVFYRIITL